MATTIKLKNGSGAPLAGDLVQGEPALDLTNKRLYTEDSGGTVIEVGTNPTSLTTGTFTSTGIDDNATSTAITIDASENVGIGTTTTTNARLTVQADGNNVSTFLSDADGTYNPYLQTFHEGINGVRVVNSSSYGGTASNYTQDVAANYIVKTGATERMRITSSGNVGIGETAPSRALDIKSASPLNINTTSNNHIHFQVNDVTTGQYASSPSLPHQLCDSTGSSPRLVVDSSGRVGIGTSSPSTGVFSSYSDLVIGETTTSTSGISFKASSTGVSSIFFADADFNRSGQIQYSHTSDSLAFVTDNATAMSIDSSGNLLVGTTSSSTTSGEGSKFLSNGRLFQVSSYSTSVQESLAMYSTGAGAYRFYVDWGGTVHATSTSISAISDQRLKENIRDLDVGLDAVLALKPRKFDWKEGKGKNVKNDRGFIAQEFEEIFPDLIDERKDPAPEGEEPYKSVRQDLIPVLVKAIQEQQAMIETLQAEVAALKGA